MHDVRYIWQKHAGTSAAINKGIKRASGGWIKYLSDDDTLIGNALENLIDTAIALKLDMVYSDYWIVDQNNRLVERVTEKVFPTQTEYALALWDRHIGNGSSTLIKRSLFKKIGYFDIDLTKGEEYDLFLKAVIVHGAKIGLCMIPTVNYRVHGGSNTRRSSYDALRNKKFIQNRIARIMEEKRPAYWFAFQSWARSYNRTGFTGNTRRLWHRFLLRLPPRLHKGFLRRYLKYKLI